MNTKISATCLVVGALLLPLAGHAEDVDSNRSSPKAFVKDSIITTRIKADLAKEKLSSLVKINVDTDNKGMVVLSGTASTNAAASKAVSLARAVKGVTSVTNQIKVVADD